jgi:enamine deaminase RidA (YjgF/YER057c/UK114 family)
MPDIEEVRLEGDGGWYDDYSFSPAIRAGDLLFCSGTIGNDTEGGVPDDPAEQFTLAFQHLADVLSAAGASFADVVEITSFHVGTEHLDTFAEVKRRFLEKPYPAWTAIGVAQLGMPGALVEIKATALCRSR